MYYLDLSVYRIGRDEKGYTIFPSTKNVGWLSPEHAFNTGVVTVKFRSKLKEILFIDKANNSGLRSKEFPEILLDESYVRSLPIKCPLCNEKVVLSATGLNYYTGDQPKSLGNSALKIHLVDENVYYSFPALIYHYIDVHNYLPPQEFIDAITNFDFNKKYDSSDHHQSIFFEKISTSEMHSMDEEINKLGAYHD